MIPQKESLQKKNFSYPSFSPSVSCWLSPLFFFSTFYLIACSLAELMKGGIEVTILIWFVLFFLFWSLKSYQHTKIVPEISYSRLSFVHTCRIRLLKKLNLWEVMLPQGGLRWLRRAFENADKSKKQTSEQQRAITQSYGSSNRSTPRDEVNKYTRTNYWLSHLSTSDGFYVLYDFAKCPWCKNKHRSH